MLRSTPFHRENYSHLIVSVIHQFYQRCHERFRDLVTDDHHHHHHHHGGGGGAGDSAPTWKKAAVWAETDDIHKCLVDLRDVLLPRDHDGDDDNDKVAERLGELLRRETRTELDHIGNRATDLDDLLHPIKKLAAIGSFYSSLVRPLVHLCLWSQAHVRCAQDWFIEHVSQLKTFVPAAADGTPSVGGSPMPDADDGLAVPLPLTPEMTKPFDALVRSYRQLADSALFTLRNEVRLRTLHSLDRASRDGVYQLAEDTTEPDPAIVEFNSDLANCELAISAAVGDSERRFVFEGLSLFMDKLLVANARFIRLANRQGLSKMQRNILALGQNLKNLGGDQPLEVNFDRSRLYWETFGRGPNVRSFSFSALLLPPSCRTDNDCGST